LREWRLPAEAGPTLSGRESHYLRFTLNELKVNDEIHGKGNEVYSSTFEETSPEVQVADEGAAGIELTFWFDVDDDSVSYERLRTLQEQRLQVMMTPRLDITDTSHGTGLYLANVAASVVGWQLSIVEVHESGRVRFALARHDGAVRSAR